MRSLRRMKQSRVHFISCAPVDCVCLTVVVVHDKRNDGARHDPRHAQRLHDPVHVEPPAAYAVLEGTRDHHAGRDDQPRHSHEPRMGLQPEKQLIDRQVLRWAGCRWHDLCEKATDTRRSLFQIGGLAACRGCIKT